jgi:hypothetical protein
MTMVIKVKKKSTWLIFISISLDERLGGTLYEEFTLSFFLLQESEEG